MPIMQERNSEAQLLGSVDHLFYDDRNFCAEWIDSGGSGGYIGAINLPLATTRHNFFTQIYSMSGAYELTVLEPGFYSFDWTVNAFKAGTTEGSMYSYLEQDPATAVWSELSGSRATATTFSAAATTHNHVVVRALAGYRYRVRIATFGVQFQTTPNQSRLSAIRLFRS